MNSLASTMTARCVEYGPSGRRACHRNSSAFASLAHGRIARPGLAGTLRCSQPCCCPKSEA
eukprot:4107265-Amphidinium_carterae.1